MEKIIDKPPILEEGQYESWRQQMKIAFKLAGAWDHIEANRKIEEVKSASQDDFKKLALKVNYALLAATKGEDNSIVCAQDETCIFSAWNSLQEKHEGSKSERLLRTFDDLILEKYEDLDKVHAYVEKYLAWAKSIKENASSVEELTKLIITTNIFRSLPEQFDPVKQRVREELNKYTVSSIGEAIKIRARELLSEQKYTEKFGTIAASNDSKEIDELNCELSYMNTGQRNGGRFDRQFAYNGDRYERDYQQNTYGRNYYQFDGNRGRGYFRGRYNFRGRRGGGRGGQQHNYERNENRISHLDQEVKRQESEESHAESAVIDNKPKKYLAHLSAIDLKGKPKKDKNVIIVDSGAKKHIFTNKELLKDIKDKSKDNDYVIVANGQEVKIMGVGRLEFKCNHRTIKLGEVYYAPGLQVNYLSCRELADIGLQTTFSECGVVKHGNDTVLYAEWAGYGYTLCYENGKKKTRTTFEEELNKSYENMVSSLDKGETLSNYEEWHDRLGHVGIETQNYIMRAMRMKTLSEFKCSSCIKAKHQRAQHKRSYDYTTRIFQRAHSDLTGPLYFKGKKIWIMSIIDDYSRYANIYVLNNKGDATRHLEDYIKKNEDRTGLRLCEFKTDNGLEFVKQEIYENILKPRRIEHLTSCPYEPPQNGKAERYNRSLYEIARAVMFHAGAGEKYMLEALAYANKVTNAVPKKRLNNKTSQELFIGKKPNYEDAHPFGCLMHAKIPDPKITGKNKKLLQPRSVECINLGPLPLGKGFKYEEIETGRRGETCNPIFEDTKYPLRDRKAKQKSESTVENKRVTRSANLAGLFDDELAGRTKIELVNESDKQEKQSEQHEEASEKIAQKPNNNENEKESNNNKANETETDERNENEQQNAMGGDQQPNVDRRQRDELEEPEYNLDEILKLDIDEERIEMTYEEAMASDESERWSEAMNEELKTAEERSAFEEVEIDWIPGDPEDTADRVTHKWLFVKKIGTNGEALRYRARLVARGFNIEIEESRKYVPTLSKQHMRLLIADALKKGHSIIQIDIKSAYLYTPLTDMIYLELPKHYQKKNERATAWRLTKAWYGLPQSGQLWYHHLKRSLNEIGLKELQNDQAVFKNDDMNLGVYVDDLMMTGPDKELEQTKTAIGKIYDFRDGGQLHYYLGTEFEVVRQQDIYKVGISNKQKIEKLVKKYQQEQTKEKSTPITYHKNQEEPQEDDQIPVQPKLLRSLIGGLNYVCASSKPECAFALSVAAAKQDIPIWKNMKAALQILIYMRDRVNEKLWMEAIDSERVLEMYTDGSFKNRFDDGQSRSGYAVYVHSCLVDWHSSKQEKVAASPAEAELLAIQESIPKVELIERVLDELMKCRDKTMICTDSETIVKDTLKNETDKSKMKNRRMEINCVKKFAESREVQHVDSSENCADIFTKSLIPKDFTEKKGYLNIYDNDQSDYELSDNEPSDDMDAVD